MCRKKEQRKKQRPMVNADKLFHSKRPNPRWLNYLPSFLAFLFFHEKKIMLQLLEYIYTLNPLLGWLCNFINFYFYIKKKQKQQTWCNFITFSQLQFSFKNSHYNLYKILINAVLFQYQKRCQCQSTQCCSALLYTFSDQPFIIIQTSLGLSSCALH